MVAKITSWSFSRWKLWDECPRKAKYKFIDRLPEPDGEPKPGEKYTPMQRGSAIHAAIEQYLKGAVPRLTKEFNLKPFAPMLREIRAKRKEDATAVAIEDTWAYRADWTETTYNDWNNCWLRIKIDCSEIDGTEDDIQIGIKDWKSGRYREDDESYALQLDLYALGALTLYKNSPKVTVAPELVYIDENKRHSPRTYTMADLKPLKAAWEKRVKPMLSDTTFAAKPNNRCRWCHFRKDNNGPCEF